MRKRVLALILVLVMCLSLLPAGAFAASGKIGTDLTWSLSKGTLTISGKGKMTDYVPGSFSPWYSSCSSVKTIVIESGVTSIGEASFRDCRNLTSVTIADTVKSIGSIAFLNCSALENVTIPDSVTSIGDEAFKNCSSLVSVSLGSGVKTIGASAFYDCSKLEGMIMPNSVTSIGEKAFWSCSSLTSVTLSDSLTSIGNYAFYSCGKLNGLTIPNGVTSIGDNAFYGCRKLVNVTIPNSVISLGNSLFYNCTGLESVTLSDNLTSLGNSLFYNCSALTGLTIPNGVKSIGNFAFYNCSALTGIIIPDSVMSIGDNAFYGCTGFTSINFGNGLVSLGASALQNCTKLAEITIGNSLEEFPASALGSSSALERFIVSEDNEKLSSVDGVLFNKDKSELMVYPINKKDEIYSVPDSVSSIAAEAFRNAHVKNVIIPDSVQTIGSSAFNNCSSLEKVKLGNGVKSIGAWAFGYCPLSEMDWGNSVETIGSDAFRSSGIKSLVLPDSVETIGIEAFMNSGVKSVVLPDSVKTVGNYAFSKCSDLESAVLSKGLKEIPERMFENCENLTEVIIPEGVTAISVGAFGGTNLREIIIPDSVTDLGNAFNGDKNLRSAVIGKGVTSLKDNLFGTCSNLTCVSFGSNIKKIGKAFTSCEKLTHIFYDGTYEQFDKIEFSDEFSALLPYLVIVADSSCEDTDKCGDTLTWRLDGDTLKIEGTGKMYDYDGDYEAPWARYGNKILNVELPEGLESIGEYAMDCLPLVESIFIPARVSSIPPMPFLYCSSLKSITVDENNPCFAAQDGVLYSKDMTTLLSYPICKSDETFTFHSGLQYFEQLSMFANLDLKSVNVDAGNPYFSSDNGLVYDKEQKEFLFMPYSTTKLVFPDTVERIADNAVITGKNLTSVKFSASFKKTIDPSYFIGCTNLKSVTVDSNNKYYTSDKDVLFSKDKKTLVWYPQAKSASSYTIPSGVTTIGDYAFLYTEDLEELTVPNTLTSIGSYAFYMSGIIKFVFHGSSGQLNRIKIADGNDVLATVKVEVDSYAPGLTGTTSSGKPKLSWDKVEGATKYELYRATSKSGKYTKLTTVTGTSYTDKSAEIGKTYYYKVRGTATISGQKAYSDYSEIVSVKCTPAAPTVTLSVVTSSGKIKVSWKAIDGAEKYEVYRATSSNGTYKKLTTTTKTSYTNTSATAGTKYYYKVRALSASGTAGNYSSVKNIICDLAQPVVTLSNVSSSGKIKVSWKAVDGASKYEVYRATSSSGTYKKLTSTTSTSYTDTSAKAGSKYYYKVKAICSKTSDGNSAYSAVKNLVCDLAKPTAKIALKSGHPKVTWAKIDGASKYEVYRATSKSGTYTKLTTTSSASYTDKNAKAGKTYYYKVKAVCSKTSDGNSAYSSVVNIKAK